MALIEICHESRQLVFEWSFLPGQHVAASLSLFASVALLFWYVLQFLMRFGRD